MDPTVENGFPNLLQRLLDESTFSAAKLSAALVDLEKEYGEQIYPQVLFRLTRMDFSPEAAKKHMGEVLSRHRELSAILGREVGLRTAVCDYFLSHEHVFREPVVVETRILLQNEQYALLDELTGLHNRRYFNMQLKKEIERSRRSAFHFSLLLVDVDHFKNYNDTYGHIAGDSALKQIAECLKDTAREMDHVARYGGEEFVLILPQTSKKEAVKAAERHRRRVEEHKFDQGRLTISIGVAVFPLDADNESELLFRTDFALYRAKNRGRNQVCNEFTDRRQNLRLNIELPVDCILDGSEPLSLTTVNIGESGMLCRSSKPMDLGAELEARIKDVETGEVLPLKAKPVRMIKDIEQKGVFYVGMAFQNGEASRRALQEIINRKIGDEGALGAAGHA
jgi:diguanylate cyclase (GGDEF)-like protein